MSPTISGCGASPTQPAGRRLLRRCSRCTTRDCCCQGLLLQTQGADRRIPALAPLVAEPHSTLVLHRPERRALVRLDGAWSGGQVGEDPLRRYAKLLRPGRNAGPLGSAVLVARPPGLRMPRLLLHEPALGLVVWSGLAGTALHDLLDTDITAAARRLGTALRALHQADAAGMLPVRDAGVKFAWLRVWGIGCATTSRRWRRI